MVVGNSKSIINEFRESRNQTTQVSKVTVPPSRERKQRTPYDSFLYKYDRLDEYIDSFGTRDLVYYFREVAQRCGVKYVISNIKKDMAIMKRLRENYSNREICGMIEFLFESDQDYLLKDRISINLLASQWINTIYADTKLWVSDDYVPKSVKSYDKSREWKKVNDDNTVIGEWDV